MLPLNLIEPVVTFRNSQGTAVRGTLTSLQRRALVLEIYNPYSIIQVSEVLSELTLRAGQKAVYQGRAVVTSLLNTGLMAVVSVTLIDEWSDLNAAAGSVELVRVEARRFVQDWDERFRIRNSYQVLVSELRAFLADAARWLDQADATAALPRNESGALRDDVFAELTPPLLERLRVFAERFESEAAAVPEEDVAAHRTFSQSAFHPLLLRAPFPFRAFTKPLGYAGDYEMVNQILGEPRQGGSTYLQTINLMYLSSAVVRAHRNRVDILTQRLHELAQGAPPTKPKLRVLNVGCGPAAEVLRWTQRAERVEALDFTLMDFNDETLAYVASALAALPAKLRGRLQLRTVQRSVHELLKLAVRNEADPEQYDYVYCAGLFDYLSDKVAARLVSYFIAHAAPGARILVTNVHPCNPERLAMEHVLEWHLIYRDEAQLAAVFPPDVGPVTVYTDATGVNVFAELRLRDG